MNEVLIISDEGGYMTFSLPTSRGTLRIRTGDGPGHVVKRYAIERRAWNALKTVRELARLASDGRVPGTLNGVFQPCGEVALSEMDRRLVAEQLRRCREHIRLRGMPAAGTSVSVEVPLLT